MRQAHRALELRRRIKRQTPSSIYDPTFSGDRLAFHRAPHNMRAMFTGNGYGKSLAMGMEVAEWVLHQNRWQETPDHAVLILWFCEKFSQFDILREQLETHCLPRPWIWNGQHNRYEWADGSKMWISSYDGQWEKVQGIPVDLVCFDEQPPITIYREMMMRRRGERDTRYIVAATATKSGSWMEQTIYQPWLKHHEQNGMDIEQAIKNQTHPSFWVLPRGGIEDNPWATDEQKEHFKSQVWPSEKERRVRLYGGFSNWSGDCVFDDAGLDWLRDRLRSWQVKGGETMSGSFAIDDTEDYREPEFYG